MKNAKNGQVIGIPIGSLAYSAEHLAETSGSCVYSNSCGSSQTKQNMKDAIKSWMNKISKKTNNYAKNIREHVMADPVKEKLSRGKRILQDGDVDKDFRQNFSVGKREKLVKTLQCYLSTTAGPISGMLFISTEKIAFHSDRSLTITSPEGQPIKVPYKVLIPVNRITRVNPSENSEEPNEKYVQIVTVDDFEFWFMGFGTQQQSLKNFQVKQTTSKSEALFL